MTRLELQSRALRGEVPLVPIGITHRELADPAPRADVPTTSWEQPGYLEALRVSTLETAYEGDHPLVFAYLESSAHFSPFFLVKFLQVGGTVVIDDAHGAHLHTVESKRARFAPARLTKGEKVVLKVENIDCASHSFFLTLFFAKDET